MKQTYDPRLVERGMEAMAWVMRNHFDLYWIYRSCHPSTELPIRDSKLFCHVWETLRANPRPEAVTQAHAVFDRYL